MKWCTLRCSCFRNNNDYDDNNEELHEDDNTPDNM